VLMAVAYALAPITGRCTSHRPTRRTPIWNRGYASLLDPLWSSDAVEIVHDGPNTRIEKLRLLVQYPEIMARLRVCWENIGKYNCGLCEKCIRTMLALRALGIDRCAVFPDTLTPELVRQHELNRDSVLCWRELLCPGLPPPYMRQCNQPFIATRPACRRALEPGSERSNDAWSPYASRHAY